MPASDCGLGRTAPRKRLKLSAKGRWVPSPQFPSRPVHPVAAGDWWMKAHGFRALGDPALTVPGCSFQVV